MLDSLLLVALVAEQEAFLWHLLHFLREVRYRMIGF